VLLHHYFEGAGYGFSGADDFTLNAPATLFRLDNSDNILNQHQGITSAHADTQPTSVTLFLVYHGHFSQRRPSLIYYFYFKLKANYLSVTFVS